MKFPARHSLPTIDDYLELEFDHFKITGRSVAGIETVYSIPQWNVTFDTGRAPHFAFSNDFLALTHWHLDHSGGLAFYLGLRCLNALKPLKIVVPPETVDETTEYLDQLKKVTKSRITYEIIPAGDIALKKNLKLKSVPSFHCVPSNGYLVVEERHHLKSEFKNWGQVEIVKAKEQGVTVTEKTESVLFACSGDTCCEFFETEASHAKVLLMECSFFANDSDYAKVRHYGHTHIKDWVQYAEKIQSDVVVMTHTSQRFSKQEIEKECLKLLPKSLTDRLIVFR